MIQIKELSKIYASDAGTVTALEDINLEIPSGEIFGFIGPSGAGKSTLIRCLNLLEEPTTGQIIIDGQDLTTLKTRELREARKKIGMIFQNFNLLESRTVAENVAFPLELADETSRVIESKVNKLLDLVDLADKANAYPAQLSGGQQQRVGIARALANDPKLLLCDEATSSLDPETTEDILELIQEINHKLGITVVLITHEMEVIKQICDQVAVLAGGSIVEQGETMQIFINPQAETTKRFVEKVVNADIPEEFYQRPSVLQSESDCLIKLSFVESAVDQPIISEVIQEFGIKANILYGNVDKIQQTPFGILLIELSGDRIQIEEALSYLKQQDLELEVIDDDCSIKSVS
ncbi:MAG: methionine ABC transporter ATP-binding protein [Bacillota bacterium]